jgi:hypothetical protein
VEKNKWYADALGIDKDKKSPINLPGVAEVMKSKITTDKGQQSITDVFSSFFNTPFFDQIKQAFLALMATLGPESDKDGYMIQSNYFNSLIECQRS